MFRFCSSPLVFVLVFFFPAATAAQCDKDLGGGFSICEDGPQKVKDNMKASIVFSFFLLACFIASTFFSWRDNAAEERKK